MPARRTHSSRRVQDASFLPEGSRAQTYIDTTTQPQIDHATLPGGVTAPHSSRRGDYLGAV
ncbi:hypothetical protein LINPERHAP1_LOCUS27576 [Linum perenne]